MTPNDIEVLLHCHTTPTKHPRLHAPAVSGSIIMLQNMDIISPVVVRIEGDQDQYRTTKKGEKLVEMICNTPFPTQIWADPREGENK